MQKVPFWDSHGSLDEAEVGVKGNPGHIIPQGGRHMREETREKVRVHCTGAAGDARGGHWRDTSGGPHLNSILISLARSRYLGVGCRDSEAH